MEERRETLCVRVEKKRIDCERESERRGRVSRREAMEKKKKTERKTKKERNNCESYFVVHEFLSMRVYYRKRNTFTMQSFSPRFCFWLLVFSLSFLFLRVKRDASRMATRDGEELAVRRAEEVCFSRFLSSTFSVVVVVRVV